MARNRDGEFLKCDTLLIRPPLTGFNRTGTSGDTTVDADQNGHGSPPRAGSVERLGSAPLSPPADDLSRTSSTGDGVQEQQKAEDYLLLVMLSCVCPVWPLSAVALVYSVMSRNSLQQGDVDGARRLGRLARLLSCVSIILGLLIVIICVVVTVTG